jgi:hypothetical protein
VHEHNGSGGEATGHGHSSAIAVGPYRRQPSAHGVQPAGPETWVGPTAQSCYDALLAVRRQLQSNQQTLTDTARRLERQADAIEQQPTILKLVS